MWTRVSSSIHESAISSNFRELSTTIFFHCQKNAEQQTTCTPLPHTHTNILQTYKMAPNPTMGTNDSSSSSNNNNNNNNSKSTSSGVYNKVDDDDDDKEENDNLLLDDNKTMDGPIMKWAPSDLFKSYPRTYLTYHVVTSGYAYMV